uniref:TF-B3 domain-containing protein n=1 Tax=Tanacetum cinerariifolium TaxID=118510 RepID=A0A6L2NII2_TANCI|nr:hypothetical protein [Tanacetum cinerariifolium]
MESEVVLPLPSVFAKKHLEKGRNETQPIILENISGYKWKVKYAKINNDKYYFVDGWFDFMKANCNAPLRKEDYLQMSAIGPMIQMWPMRVMGINIVKETRENHLLKNKTLFEKVIYKSYLRKMPLLKDFERVTGIDSQDRKLVRVKNDEGKIYKMFIKSWKMGPKSVPIPHLVRGWSAFMKDNNVEVGDTRVFNHVEGILLHVHVKKRLQRELKSQDDQMVSPWVVALEAYDEFVYKELGSEKSCRYSFVWPLGFAQLCSRFGYKVSVLSILAENLRKYYVEALELSIGLARTELRFLRRQLIEEIILSVTAKKERHLAYENLSTLLLQEASFSSQVYLQLRVWHSHMDLPGDPSRTIHDCIGSRTKAWILMCSEFVIQIMIAEVVPRLRIVAPTENL